MKKAISILVAVLAVVAVVMAVIIKTYITPERIKTFLVPYAEQTLNRKVSVGEINISLLTGINIKDFTIKEADGKTDFIKCRDFILKFQLLPLLSRKVIIDDLRLMSPEIRMSRDKEGRFNFEDIGKKEMPEEVKEKSAPEAKGLPVSLLVNNVSVRDSRFSFTDSTRALPDVKGSFAIDAGIKSAGGAELSSKGRVDAIFDEIIFHNPEKEMKNIRASLDYSTRIDLESKNIHIDKAELRIQEILVVVSGTVKGVIKMTARSDKGDFSLNTVADFSKPGYTYSLAASLDSFQADEVVSFFFPKARDTVSGLLSANLKLTSAGITPDSIKNNLIAAGDFNLKGGKITGARWVEGLSRFINIEELKTINIRQANGTVKIRNSVVSLDSNFTSDDIAMNPLGEIGFDERLNLSFDLKLSPRLTRKAAGSGLSKYFRDEAGWGVIPLRVSGSFSKPLYSVDITKAGRRVIEQETGKFIDKLFRKNKEDNKPREEEKSVEDLLKGIFR